MSDDVRAVLVVTMGKGFCFVLFYCGFMTKEFHIYYQICVSSAKDYAAVYSYWCLSVSLTDLSIALSVSRYDV